MIAWPRPSVLPLARSSIRAGCGTKAANLARLMALGYRVPPGVVITEREYRRHLAAGALHGTCADPARVRERILATPLAASLRATLRAELARLRWPVAVRSSATAEDTRGASFAGQLDSVLGVCDCEGLERAIRFVWASAWSERCRSYAQRQGLDPGALGVIVQEQVDARCSGVLFSRDPLEVAHPAQAVIECVPGLGDQLVGGTVNPSRLRVRYADFALERSVGDQLSDREARELAAIGLTLERALGGPQDIEWSIDRVDRIVLLQARPITATARLSATVWSNANIAENYPDPVTPLLFSIVSRGYSAYFRNLALGFGIARRRVAAMAESLDEIVGLHAGRLYYNLSNIHAALHLAPGGQRLAAAFNRFTGARERPEARTVPLTTVERATECVRVVAWTAWKYLWIERRVSAFEARVDAYAARTRPADLARRGAAELARDLAGFLEIRLERWNDAGLADAAAMVCYALLERVVAQAAPRGEAQALQHDLLKGLPGLASAQPVAELWTLSRRVRGDRALLDLFATHTADEIAARLGCPELQAFRPHFERYLDLWGFRYSRELMLTSPTPQEHPAPLIAILQSYLRDDGPGPLALSAEQARARLVATESLGVRLPIHRAWLLRLVLRATQGSIRLRERVRMKQALLYTRLRHVVLRLGELLVERGLLAQPDDVFFITVDEAALSLEAQEAPTLTSLPAAVAERQRTFATWADQQPPDSFALAHGASWQATEAQAGLRGCVPSDALRGTSACGGTVEGTAQVIEDVAGIGAFRAGEILVTRQTDPGWAAVFFMVKGLVIERGGMLSHGAIIAREYGIPAVVGVDDATRRIRSGDNVRIDGDNGVVHVARG